MFSSVYEISISIKKRNHIELNERKKIGIKFINLNNSHIHIFIICDFIQYKKKIL